MLSKIPKLISSALHKIYHCPVCSTTTFSPPIPKTHSLQYTHLRDTQTYSTQSASYPPNNSKTVRYDRRCLTVLLGVHSLSGPRASIRERYPRSCLNCVCGCDSIPFPGLYLSTRSRPRSTFSRALHSDCIFFGKDIVERLFHVVEAYLGTVWMSVARTYFVSSYISVASLHALPLGSVLSCNVKHYLTYPALVICPKLNPYVKNSGRTVMCTFESRFTSWRCSTT